LLNPALAGLLPLAALPVLFHLFFRRRRPTRAVSTLMFFHRIDPRLDARRRLREWLVLLLRALVLAAVVLALGHPIWFGVGRTRGVATVWVIDNSASMAGAGPDGRSRLDRAVDAVRDAVRGLGAEDAGNLVLLVPDPRVPTSGGLTSDRTLLASLLSQVRETEAMGSVAGAIDRAASLLAGVAGDRAICVYSDLQEAKWTVTPVEARSLPPGVRLIVQRVPATAEDPNLSLVAADGPAGGSVAGRPVRIEVQVRAAGTAAGRGRLTWEDDLGRRGGQEIEVAASQARGIPLAIEPAGPGLHWAWVSIEGDAFTADNRAGVAWWCLDKPSVWLVGNPAEFGTLPLALSPDPAGQLGSVTRSFVEATALAAALGAGAPGFQAMAWSLPGRLGAKQGATWQLLRGFVERGGTLLLLAEPGGAAAAGPFPDWLGIRPEAPRRSPDGLAVTARDAGDPLFADLRTARGEVGLGRVKAFQFLPLMVAATNQALLALEDGTVVLARMRLGRGAVLGSGLAFDTASSTLPLKPGFVALAQAMALQRATAPTNIIPLVAGDPLPSALAPDVPVRVRSLGGSALDWKGRAGDLRTLPCAGVFALESPAAKPVLAVQAAEREGRRSFLTGDRLPALGTLPYTLGDLGRTRPGSEPEARQPRSLDLALPLWLLALALVAAESALANPRPTPARRAARAGSAPVSAVT
jgi:hypothetical protein